MKTREIFVGPHGLEHYVMSLRAPLTVYKITEQMERNDVERRSRCGLPSEGMPFTNGAFR